jgi:hypothetical protein
MLPINFRKLLTLILLVSMTTCAWAGSWQGREVIEDGIKHVINPDQPLDGSKVVKAQELWRLGGESDAEEEMFGRVESALMDRQNNLYFLDSQLNEIRVFSEQGDYLRTIGQEGEGPGEFRNAMGQFLLPEDRLGVMQMMPTRISVLDLQGNAQSDLVLDLATSSAMLMIQQIQCLGDKIVFSYIQPRITDARKVFIDRKLQVASSSGQNLKTLKSETEEQSQGGAISINLSNSDNEDFFSDWELTSDGNVVVAPYYDTYQIWSFDTVSGEPTVIQRDYERRRRSRQEIAEIRERTADNAPEINGAQVDIEVPEYDRDIARLITRPDGELWVVSSRAQNERLDDALPTFDVFDPRGRFLRQITIKAEFNPEFDSFSIVGNRLFIFKEALSGGDAVSTSGGGGHQMMMIRRSSGNDDDDDREAEPFAIICYDLPL